MIISKPKSRALTALGIFIIICFAVGGYALRAVVNNVGEWYHYVIASISLIIGFVLFIRQLFTYKVILINEKSIKINYALRWKSIEFKLAELIEWKETIIETKNSPFKQLVLKFNKFLLKLSVQENTNYDKIYKFLKKRVAKREIK